MFSSKLKNGLMLGGGFLTVFLVLFALLVFSEKKAIQEASTQTGAIPQTKTLADVTHQLMLEKPGKIVSTQDILVTAQANGKVAKILAKAGDSVKGGQPIVQLADTVASYKLQVERAKNGLDRALLMKEQTELTLNQQLQQSENAYKTAQQAFEHAKKMSETAIKQAGLGLTTAESQFDALKNSFQMQKIALLNVLDAVVESADALLGVTDYYEEQLKGKEIYLGAKDQTQKNLAKESLRALYTTREELKKLSDIPQDASMLMTGTNLLNSSYEKMISFAGLMVEVLRNSIASQGTLGEAEINKHIQTFQTFQSGVGVQQARSAFVAYFNQVNAQLNGTSTLNQENAELSYQNTLANTENSLFQAEIALKNARINYETLLANKELQLDLLGNAIVDAKIAYESALIQYNKLEVRSPVSGVIGDIMVSEGQEIGMGTQIFKVSGTKKQQIEVYLSADEYQYIQDKEPVQVSYQDQLLTGLIDAVSTVADKTNLFKATIQLSADIPLLGDVAKVSFPIKISESAILPLEQVKILNDNEGEISILRSGKVEAFPVKIKRVWGSFVELKEALPADLELVLK